MVQQAPAPSMNIGQQNALARQAIFARATPMRQNIFNQNINPAVQNGPVQVQLGYIGLVRGFYVIVSGTLHNGEDTETLTLSEFGASNILSNIRFTDLWNQERINIPGWAQMMNNASKQPFVMNAALVPNIGVNFGNNLNVAKAPATIAAGADGAVQFVYYVPIAYNAFDLRGAMWASVVNATSNLALTINANPIVASTGDELNAIYTSDGAIAASGWKSGTTVNVSVYQDYFDKVPTWGEIGLQSPNGDPSEPFLPLADMQVYYELKQTSVTGMAANQDFPVSYQNFREFLSTTAVIDNGGTYYAGTDVNSIKLIAANTTRIFDDTIPMIGTQMRKVFHADPPLGTYYFDHRDKPILTTNTGNIALNFNMATVNANANPTQILMLWEAFAQTKAIQFAGSLSGG